LCTEYVTISLQILRDGKFIISSTEKLFYKKTEFNRQKLSGFVRTTLLELVENQIDLQTYTII